MRQQPTPNLKAIDLVETGIGLDRCKLQNLIEVGRDAGRLGIIEYERHLEPPAERNTFP